MTARAAKEHSVELALLAVRCARACAVVALGLELLCDCDFLQVQDTKRGVIEDKVIKNSFSCTVAYAAIKDTPSVEVVTEASAAARSLVECGSEPRVLPPPSHK